MKARWDMTCECCKAPIDMGERILIYAGRPWKPDHLRAYKRRRITARSGR